MAFWHSVLETGFIALMAAWVISGVVFALPLWRLRRRLNRWNHGLWFANWTVFGSGRERSEICVYPLEYRDLAGGAPGAWIEVMSGRSWAWHSCLWQPQRRVADRIHRIGQNVARTMENGTKAEPWLLEQQAMLKKHLVATCPRPAGNIREVRMRMRRSVIDRPDDCLGGAWGRARFEECVLLQFSINGGDHDS